MKVTVLVGLQHGDEGKGKISHALNTENSFDCFVRFNGGPNAGHTIYHNGNKVVLHQIPCGIMQNKPCLISSSCVVDINKLNVEAEMLKEIGINVKDLLHIAYNVHIITNDNIEEDKKTNVIGTTGSGIGPTYSHKALRTGTRFCDIESEYKSVKPFEFLSNYTNIFMEGAQGFELDIDYGDYPFVTSSSCITGSIFINGISPHIVPSVVGVSKLYDTYVGSKKFQPDDEVFVKLQELGHEFGATTGRSRQCNWLNITKLINSININGVNTIYINKCDVIEDLGVFKILEEINGIMETLEFETIDDMKNYIRYTLINRANARSVIFSGNPNHI